jgi:hypothetical protein
MGDDERTEKLQGVEARADIIDDGGKLRGYKGVYGYGLCDTCNRLILIESEFSEELVLCDIDDLDSRRYRPTKGKPIKRCTQYKKRGEMDISDMKRIAWLIDVGVGKPIGFIKPDYKRRWEN